MQSNNLFAERLKEERGKLGLNQEDFGKACGVKKLAQFNYEKGERKPDSEYLQKAHELGVDVSYLLTGIHSDTLKESAEIDNYQIDGAVQSIESTRMNAMFNEPEVREALQTMTDEQVKAMINLVKSFAGSQ